MIEMETLPVLLTALFLWGYLFASMASFGDLLAERILNAHYRKSRKKITRKNRYIWGGRSRCDHCQEQIKVLHLLPVFGFLASRGECPQCAHKLSRRYLYQESAAFFYGAMLALIYSFWPSLENAISPAKIFDGWVYLAFCASYLPVCIVIAKVDHEFFLIPLEATFAILFIGFLEFFLSSPNIKEITMTLSITLAWFFILLLLYLFYKDKLGLGDLYLVFAMCIALAFPRSLYLPTLASLAGILWHVLQRKRGQKLLKIKVAFGLYLVLAFLVLRMFPSEILF